MIDKYICIFGSEGNMGKRYSSILNYLYYKWIGVDIVNHPSSMDRIYNYYNYYIIATPTDTHAKIIKDIKSPKANILCEKPITKDIAELKEIYALCKERYQSLFMVDNYCHCDLLHSSFNYTNNTLYDYYNSGKDGLAWDCIQLINLASDKICLYNYSPEWTCAINGKTVSRDSIDRSYVLMIRTFLDDKMHMNENRMIKLHENTGRIQDEINKSKNGCYRGPSKIEQS